MPHIIVKVWGGPTNRSANSRMRSPGTSWPFSTPVMSVAFRRGECAGTGSGKRKKQQT